MNSYDVIVIGAGPAGVASALKCVRQGYNTLLLEKEHPGRHKPCGGVVPTLCFDLLEEDLDLKVPPNVICTPETLGLFYVPPSGRVNGGNVRNYSLFNLDRDLFDQWLCQTAEDSGVKVLYGTKFLELHMSEMINVTIKEKENITGLKTRYLIGADGVFSKVRRQLYPDLERNTLTIVQEYWQAKGDFDDYFYVVLNGDITPSYGYLIPKNDIFIIGTGVTTRYPVSIHTCLERFKEYLCREFAFDPVSLQRREFAAIPYNSIFYGTGNVILIGEAAGFCNSFSGEGIRLAIESGILAVEAIELADHSNQPVSSIYAQQVKGLGEFIHKTYEFATSLTDLEREYFISTQLKRPQAL